MDASKDDEYFRLALTIREDVFDNPAVQVILPKVRRSLRKPSKRGYLQSIINDLREIDLKTPGGLFLGHRLADMADLERLDRVISRITKGLFYKELGYPLPKEYISMSFSESGLSDLDDKVKKGIQEHFIPIILSTEPTSIGEKVFTYWSVITQEDQNTSIWIMEFFENIRFLSMTVKIRSNASS